MLVTLALVVFVGGCGAGNSASELATQDKTVQLGNQLSAMHKRVAQAQRLVAKQRRNAARRAALQSRPRASARPSVQVVRTTDFSLSSLCRPEKLSGNSRAARRLRQQHGRARRQVLYALNLSCPATRS